MLAPWAAAVMIALTVGFARAAELDGINPLRSGPQTQSIPKINPLTRRVDFFDMLKRTKTRVGRKVVIQPVIFQVEFQVEEESKSPNDLPAIDFEVEPESEPETELEPETEPEAKAETVPEAEEIEKIVPLKRTGDFPRKPIGQVTTNIAQPRGDQPNDYAATAFEYYNKNGHYRQPARGWQTTPFEWDAPALCHRPLYFEEVNLERYGYSGGLIQPAVSAAHFFGSVLALPYKTCVEPPDQCIYTLGHYRPGSCVPYRYHYPSFSADAGLWQAGLVTGLIFLIP